MAEGIEELRRALTGDVLEPDDREYEKMDRRRKSFVDVEDHQQPGRDSEGSEEGEDPGADHPPWAARADRCAAQDQASA